MMTGYYAFGVFKNELLLKIRAVVYFGAASCEELPKVNCQDGIVRGATDLTGGVNYVV
jgi:hypothetical protein